MTMPMLAAATAAAAGLLAAPYLAGLTVPAAAHSAHQLGELVATPHDDPPAHRPHRRPSPWCWLALAGAGAGAHADWPAFLALALAGTRPRARRRRTAPAAQQDPAGRRRRRRRAADRRRRHRPPLGRPRTSGSRRRRGVRVPLPAALASPRSVGLGDVKLAGLLAGYLAWRSWLTMVAGLALGFLAAGVAAARRCSRPAAATRSRWAHS